MTATADNGPKSGEIDARAVTAECIRQICPRPLSELAAGMLAALVLAVLLNHQVARSMAWWWLACISIARLMKREAARNLAAVADSPTKSATRVFLAAQFLEGTLWGVSPYLLRLNDRDYEVLLVGMLLSVSFISVIVLAPFVPAAVAFTLPVNAGLAVWFASQRARWGWFGAIGVVLLYAFTITQTRESNATLRRAVAARLEISRMAEQLDRARARAEYANQELRSHNNHLHEEARRDPLTGLFNRRHFLEVLDGYCARTDETPWFLTIFDADFFKRINDEHGHQAGDRVLIAIAEAAKNEIRENDCFARLGGEEFGLLIEGISRQRAVTIVERIRTAVTRMELGFGHITLSAGLIIGESNMAASVALARADAVMYEAKRLGRDQLVCESA